MTKFEYAARMAGALCYLMLSQADSVGLTVFDAEARESVAPRSKRGHLRNIVRTLSSVRPGGESDIARVLHDAAESARRRGLFIVISDFFGEPEGILSGISHLRHRRHEVIAFQVVDRAEVEFPFRSWTRFQSLEVSSRFRLVDPAAMARAYRERFREHVERLKEGLLARSIDFVSFVTDEPLGEALSGYLSLRMARGRSAREPRPAALCCRAGVGA
jgi:uncharacterized protein (DUF58 family)